MVREREYEMYFGKSLVIGGVPMAETSYNYANYIEPLISDGAGGTAAARREMYDKMNCSTETFTFATLARAQENYDIRQGFIANMQAANAGTLDFDYYNRATMTYPRIGDTYVQTTDAFTPADDVNHNGLCDVGEYYTDSNGNGDYDPPTWNIGAYWEPADPTNVWGWTFVAKSTPYEAMLHITPFRGECAGATQLCLLKAAADVIGDSRFDAVHVSGITIDGSWSAFNRHAASVGDVATHIPGDYVYIKNKDDYPIFAPGGYWRGENLVYDGGGTYTGLGGNSKTLAQWRDLLQDAYNNDCKEPFTDVNGNGTYDVGEPFEDRDGDSLWDDPHVDDTEAETAIRFTKLLRVKAGD